MTGPSMTMPQTSVRSGPAKDIILKNACRSYHYGSNTMISQRTNLVATKMFMDGAIRSKGLQQPLAKLSSMNT